MFSEPPSITSSLTGNKQTKTSKLKGIYGSLENLFSYLNNAVLNVNNSKLFAGLMIITLNISSKFVSVKLSPSMEAYLKYTFSRNILIFAIVWIGTREIYVSIFITFVFIVCVDYLFNENSWVCCLPEQFTDYHKSLLENVSEEDYIKSLTTVEKYKKQKNEKTKENEKTQKENPMDFHKGFSFIPSLLSVQ